MSLSSEFALSQPVREEINNKQLSLCNSFLYIASKTAPSTLSIALCFVDSNYTDIITKSTIHDAQFYCNRLCQLKDTSTMVTFVANRLPD